MTTPTNVKNGQYVLVDCIGRMKIVDKVLGSYGCTVYKIVAGKMVRQFHW